MMTISGMIGRYWLSLANLCRFNVSFLDIESNVVRVLCRAADAAVIDAVGPTNPGDYVKVTGAFQSDGEFLVSSFETVKP